MKYRLLILAILALANISRAVAQQDEIKLDATQPKITTVSAMRVRKAPQVNADEIVRLKLGTVVTAIARSTNQDTISGKTDYWYRVNLPAGGNGWVFGGLLLDHSPGQRQELLRQIIEARLKATNTDFADRQEIYELADSSIHEAKDTSSRAEFELLKLLALASWAVSFPNDRADEPQYKKWVKAHEPELVPDEFGGSYNLRTDLLWDLEKKYRRLPIADRIAWEAALNPQPSDCEGDEVCYLSRIIGEIKYLSLYPNGAHAATALKDLTEGITDDVIRRANAKGGDQYAVEEQADLKKQFASLRLAVAKTRAPQKTALLKKLARINR